jgi:hypothetical protein
MPAEVVNAVARSQRVWASVAFEQEKVAFVSCSIIIM